MNQLIVTSELAQYLLLDESYDLTRSSLSIILSDVGSLVLPLFSACITESLGGEVSPLRFVGVTFAILLKFAPAGHHDSHHHQQRSNVVFSTQETTYTGWVPTVISMSEMIAPSRCHTKLSLDSFTIVFLALAFNAFTRRRMYTCAFRFFFIDHYVPLTVALYVSLVL